MASGFSTAATITDLPAVTVNATQSSVSPASGSLVFPTQEQLLYGMQFQFMKYKYDITGTKANLTNNINGACIMLPLPLQLVESLGLTYNAQSLGVEGFLFNKAYHGVNELASRLQANNGVADLFSNEAHKLIPDIMKSSAYVVRGLIKDASQGLGDSVDLAFGNVVNPYTIATFQNAQNRQHSFTFRLIPQNPDDSQVIQDICDNFKWHSLPDKDSTGLFLDMPEEVEVCFFGTGFLYKFARCVITGIQVNHAAFGMASFFAQDGAPTAVELSLQLEEIETLTKTAYGTPNTVVQATDSGPFSPATSSPNTTSAPSDLNNSFSWMSSNQATNDFNSVGGGL